MQTTVHLWRIGTIAALIAAAIAGGFFITRHDTAQPSGDTAADQQIDLSTIATTTHIGGYTIEPVPFTGSAILPAPDYEKPIAFHASVSAEVRSAIEAQFTEVKIMLAKDPKDINAWTRLGTIKKIAGDYAGAEDAWVYVTQTWPNDPVAFGNLADLYRTEGNTAKARAMYDAAIAKATASGNTTLADSYKSERDSL